MYFLEVKHGRRWERSGADHNIAPLVTFAVTIFPGRSYRVRSQASTPVITHIVHPLASADTNYRAELGL